MTNYSKSLSMYGHIEAASGEDSHQYDFVTEAIEAGIFNPETDVYLADIYVNPEYRKHGIALEWLKQLAKEVSETGNIAGRLMSEAGYGKKLEETYVSYGGKIVIDDNFDKYVVFSIQKLRLI